MADTITVTLPELPLVARATGDEDIAVWEQGRLLRIKQAALRGTRIFSGASAPPSLPSQIMELRPTLDDRWRNTETGDEWKVTSLDPFAWTPDGNVKGADGASTEPGPPGPPGATGAPGPSGRAMTKVAAQTIPDWRAVIVTPDDRFQVADSRNASHRQRVVGIVASGGGSGASLVAQTSGDLKGASAGFPPGSPLFVGANGTLVATPPSSGWRQIIGTAVGSNQIVVAIGEASTVLPAADETVTLRLLSANGEPAEAPLLPVLGAGVPKTPFTLNGEGTTFGAAVESATNFLPKLPQAMVRTQDSKLGDAAPTPFDFASLAVGQDWTAAVQAALNESATTQLPLAIFRPFNVTRVVAPRFASIHSGGGGLRGIATGATNSVNALLDMPEGNIAITGRFSVDGQYNLAYRRGVHNYGPQTQFSFPTNLAINGFQVGYTHGSRDFPHGIVSEATVTGLYTYGCPICAEVIGTETIVHFVGCQLISDVFGAPNTWSALPRRVVRSIGASAYFLGGEACITDTINGYVAEMQPLDSTRPTIEGTRYGAVRFLGVEMETASPFLLAHNPAALGINQPANRSYFGFDGCGGFVSQDQVMSYIADDCPIDIVIGESNEFPFPGGPKTKSAWFIDGTSGRAHVYLPSKPLGMNWLDPLAEVINGVMHWKGERTIFRATNPNAQAYTANTPSAIAFKSVDQAGGLSRFAGGYNSANGFWQLQQVGGLKDAVAIATVAFTTSVSGVISIVNQAGAVLAASPIASGIGAVTADLGKLDSGNFIYVNVVVTTNATLDVSNAGGRYKNNLTIKARN